MRPYDFTDMALELKGVDVLSQTFRLSYDIKKTVSVLDKASAQKFGKPEGKYITLGNQNFYKDDKVKSALSHALSECFKELFAHLNITPKKILFVGIGNTLMTADALGPETALKIKVKPPIDSTVMSDTAQNKDVSQIFAQGGGEPNLPTSHSICTLIPGVIGVTGIESFDLVSATVKKINPCVVIAADTLAANNTSRLCRTFQATTAGLIPGGGVKNHRPALNSEQLGVPVIAVGVPLVVNAWALCFSGAKNSGVQYNKTPESFSAFLNSRIDLKDMIVTVKDINVAVKECSDVIAGAVNLLL